MVSPGEAAKIGGRSITGVSGPSGWVRSTTLIRPLSQFFDQQWDERRCQAPSFGQFRSRRYALLLLPLSDGALEVEAVFRQLAGPSRNVRADGLDLGHDGRQFVAGKGRRGGFRKFVRVVSARDNIWDAGAAGDGGQIGAGRGGVWAKPPTESRLRCRRRGGSGSAGGSAPAWSAPPRFISTEPSPSITTTFSCGRSSASPSPMDEASPMACSR